MSKFESIILMLFVISGSLSSHAADETRAFFDDYAREMGERNLPLVLIVGCGHGEKYSSKGEDHSHPDSWCVNLKTDPSLKSFPGYDPETFARTVNYDELLDIAQFHGKPRRDSDKTLRDNVEPPQTAAIVNFRDTFDVIVLERPLPDTINRPWTMWNVTHMLKIGGQLIIDSCDGYRSGLYDPTKNFATVCSNDEHLASIAEQDIAPRFIVQFAVERTAYNTNYDFVFLANFLRAWHFTDVINVERARSPFVNAPGADMSTARPTRILSAIKTKMTDEALILWGSKILSIRGHAVMQAPK